jgi:PAT family beta-lactamase induction signal transducer AmpG
LVLAARVGWTAAYIACAAFALPAMLVGVVMGEPPRHREPAKPHGAVEAVVAYFSPLLEFLRREGALVVLLFVLIHKIGDTLANLTLRLLFADLGFSNDEIAFYDIGVGFVALLIGIFVGGMVYARLGMKRSVLISLILMAVSNFSFAALAAAGHSNLGMAAAVGFENFASGMGGVTVVAYLSALCNLRFTATQYALLSALASIAGRFLTGTTVGALLDAIGYVNFYVLTTLIALPGVFLFWFMIRSGLADVSIGSAGKEAS